MGKKKRKGNPLTYPYQYRGGSKEFVKAVQYTGKNGEEINGMIGEERTTKHFKREFPNTLVFIDKSEKKSLLYEGYWIILRRNGDVLISENDVFSIGYTKVYSAGVPVNEPFVILDSLDLF